MTSKVSMTTVLEEAREHERNYEWLKAAKSYEQALHLEPINVDFVAETWERVGYCYSWASRQTEDPEEFKKLRRFAVKAFKSAAKLFERKDSLANKGRTSQCSAIAKYMNSWLASNSSEKRQMLDKCLRHGKNSLEAYKGAGDELSYGKMCNDLLLCLFERLYVAQEHSELRRIAQEGINLADEAMVVLLKLGDKSELLRAFFTASLQSWYAANISEQEEKRKELAQRSLNYSKKALKLSKDVSNPYLSAMSYWAAAFSTLYFTEKVESSLKYAKKMLKQGIVARDNYLKGVAFYILAHVTNWIALKEADPEKQKEGYGKIIKYAKEAVQYLKLVSQDFFIAEVYLFYVESCSSLASVKASVEEKRSILEKSVETGREGLEYAFRSGSLDATGSTLHALSKALYSYSNLETRRDEKTNLLKEALAHRKEYNKIVERAFPSSYWIRGIGKNYEGLIEAELARLETNNDKKRALLESAVLNMEDGVSCCRKDISSFPVPTHIAALGGFEDSFGGILDGLYLLTEDEEILNKTIKVYMDAAKDFKDASLPSRVAESYWKIARIQDRVGKHKEAAEKFEEAFAEFKDAAQKITQFADFYLDHAVYMRAWSEIERAKLAHENEEFALAIKHYEEAASLLKPSKLWGYISPNFLAWSLLEQAEDLSRREKSIESTEVFKKAAKLFEQAREAFEKEINKIYNLDEREQAIELSNASMQRKDYCLARVNVEEARMYDLKGEHAESAEKYDSATTALEKIWETMETETERKEIKLIACMSRAWQKKKIADRKASPELYFEASDLFLKTKEYSTKDKATLLASGNSSFCRALGHGTKFEATRETDDFSKAKKFLESAANYYLKAGFEAASLWASATEILYDAYFYMSSAEIEIEPEKKMETYRLAEKCLEQSAELYKSAGYIGRRDEILKILEKVKQKREFALSLIELMTTPSDASSTRAISTPSPTVEEPVGLSKFERAFIEANLILHQTEVIVGDEFNLEIQLANLGKNVASLVNVEEIVPEGFDVEKKPEQSIVYDRILSLGGRKLPPLETTEIRLTLKAKKKGKVTFTPKVQYVDETGEHKSCHLGQISVTVKELGIRGWLKGPES